MRNLSSTINKLAAGGATALVMALAMIKPFEGIEYKPYYDVAGVLTVCYGHTGSDIIKDKLYSQSECESLLKKDLDKVKKRIDPMITVALPETTKAALYSFTYNVGAGAFSRSTLLKLLNSGDLLGACGELRLWVYAGGKKWKGLITRRQIEEEVCRISNSPQ